MSTHTSHIESTEGEQASRDCEYESCIRAQVNLTQAKCESEDNVCNMPQCNYVYSDIQLSYASVEYTDLVEKTRQVLTDMKNICEESQCCIPAYASAVENSKQVPSDRRCIYEDYDSLYYRKI